jgi:hypothetical protein
VPNHLQKTNTKTAKQQGSLAGDLDPKSTPTPRHLKNDINYIRTLESCSSPHLDVLLLKSYFLLHRFQTVLEPLEVIKRNMLLPFVYIVAIAFIFTGPIEATTCYNPDRTTASNSVPCGSDNTTFCCTTGAICLSTGYCLSVTTQPFMLYRGSCTNSEWGSSCAYYCGRLLLISRPCIPDS